MKQALFDYLTRFINIDEQEKRLIDTVFQLKYWEKGEYFLAQGEKMGRMISEQSFLEAI